MEAFSYQQHQPFLLDSVYIPDTPIVMPLLPHQAGEMSNVSSCFTCYHTSEAIPENSTSSLDVLLLPKPQAPIEKKRKQSNGSCSSTGQSKGAKESKSRRQKNPNGGLKGAEEEKKAKACNLKGRKASEEPPSGYIHVRARSGQATDSHSLAERVRRERISERMKKLQGLVPGCDKVIGKALVLDEIINYVQSLQNQVEFLSMKLASVNPILYDFGVGIDDFMNQPEEMGSMSQPMPSVIQTNHIPPTAFEGATNNFQVIESSAAFSLHGTVAVFQCKWVTTEEGFLAKLISTTCALSSRGKKELNAYKGAILYTNGCQRTVQKSR